MSCEFKHESAKLSKAIRLMRINYRRRDRTRGNMVSREESQNHLSMRFERSYFYSF